MKKYKVDVHFIQTVEVEAHNAKSACNKAIKLANPKNGFNDVNSQVIFKRYNFKGYGTETINEE